MAGEQKIEILRKARRRRTGPVVFSTMRDESYHLPFFLDHYRNLGIADFLIYDDSSSDGTTEYLLSQDDVSVITSDVPYCAKVAGEQRWSSVLKQTIPNTFIKTGWVILADADEYLYVPGNFGDIIEFVRILEAQGSICAAASMVDFYPERLVDRLYPRDAPPSSKCRYFDKGKLFDWPPGQLAPQQIRAGLRVRLLNLLEQRHAEEYRRIFGATGPELAKTWNVPVLRCGTKAVVWNQHDVTVPPPDNVRLSFAHYKFTYKFTPDLDAKISYALTSKAYFNASAEYVFLDAALRHIENVSLIGPETVEFENAASLETAGHMFLR